MTGYYQINMNGHPIGLKFGYYAVKWHTIDCEDFFSEYYETNDQGEVIGLTIMGLANLVHAAYKNNQLLKKLQPSLTMEDFYDWLFDQNQTPEGQKVITEISDTYNNSREVKVFTEKLREATEDIKKKTAELSLNG